MNDLVSVIVPYFQKKKYFTKSINSIFNLKNLKVIITLAKVVFDNYIKYKSYFFNK